MDCVEEKNSLRDNVLANFKHNFPKLAVVSSLISPLYNKEEWEIISDFLKGCRENKEREDNRAFRDGILSLLKKRGGFAEEGESSVDKARALHMDFLMGSLFDDSRYKLAFLGEALSLGDGEDVQDPLLRRRYLLALEEKIAIMMREKHNFAFIGQAVDEFLQKVADYGDEYKTQTCYIRQIGAVAAHELGDDEKALGIFDHVSGEVEVSPNAYVFGYLTFLSFFFPLFFVPRFLVVYSLL